MTRTRVLVLVLVSLALLLAAFVPEADASTRQERKAVAKQAEKYIGVRYGSGPNRMTCTDLTRMSYGKSLGIWLPGTVYGQKRAGFKVQGPPKRGDLVFYDSYKNGLIDHVALYVGNGQVIDANAYWGKTLKHNWRSIPGYVTHRRVT